MKIKTWGFLLVAACEIVLGQVQQRGMTGIIVTADGRPAAGIRVSAMAAATSAIAGATQSDASGRYRIAGLPPGAYFIVAGDTASPTYYPGVTSLATARPVTLGSGLVTTDRLDFSLGSFGYRVAGKIRGASNLGANNGNNRYTVRLTDSPAGNPRGGLTLQSPIGADGSFEFPKVIPGTYTASIEPTYMGAVPKQIVVGASNIPDLELIVPRTVRIPGRIVVEGDGPIPQIGGLSAIGPTIPLKLTIAARTIDNGFMLDTSGGFLASLPEGEYSINLGDGLSSLYRIVSFKYGNIDVRGKPVTIRGDDPQELVLRLDILSHPVTVRGRVTNTAVVVSRMTGTSGEPLVSLRGGPQTFAFPLAVPMQPDGTFEFPKVFPGEYSIRLANQTEPFSIRVADRDIDSIVLSPMPDSPNNLPYIPVAWRVLVDGGYPAPEFALTLTGPRTLAQRPVNGPPESDGMFKTYVPQEGEYRIRVDNVPPDYRLKSMVSDSIDLLTDPIPFSRSKRTEIAVTFEVTHPEEWADVRGILHGMANLPGSASRLSVSMGGRPSLQVALVTVNPDGTFEFPKVHEGTYTVALQTREIDGSSSVILTKPLTVTRAGNTIDFDIPPTVVIQGRVVVDGNGPIPCLSMSVEGSSRAFNSDCKQDGSFTVALPVGEHTIQPWGFPIGYYWLKSMAYGPTDLLQQKIVVNTTDTRTIVITLGVMQSASWAKVSGHVAGNAGVPGTRAQSVVLQMQFFGSLFEAPIQPDGSFEFARVLPGLYLAHIASVSGNLKSETIVVPESGLSELQIPLN